ncbi:hypothetical protein, partial [Dinoroseobacter shibae]|uniref:hypothetical protein n=1 Tax=Dinoroseobacter shibae TaxID=215813 RepID=UPI0030EC42BA
METSPAREPSCQAKALISLGFSQKPQIRAHKYPSPPRDVQFRTYTPRIIAVSLHPRQVQIHPIGSTDTL